MTDYSTASLISALEIAARIVNGDDRPKRPQEREELAKRVMAAQRALIALDAAVSVSNAPAPPRPKHD